MSQEQEDRIADLEDALHQAQRTISFMHGCLTDPKYRYAYPEQTLKLLEEFHKLAPAPRGCFHSIRPRNTDCPDCRDSLDRAIKKRERNERRRIQ